MSTIVLFQNEPMALSCQLMVDDDKQAGDAELADRVREAIKVSGRSQRQIAIEVGVAPQSITKWLRLGYIDKKNIPAFCRACGVSIEWFLTGAGSVTADNPLREASDEEIIRAATERLSGPGQAALLRDLEIGSNQCSCLFPSTRFGCLFQQSAQLNLKRIHSLTPPVWPRRFRHLAGSPGFAPWKYTTGYLTSPQLHIELVGIDHLVNEVLEEFGHGSLTSLPQCFSELIATTIGLASAIATNRRAKDLRPI